MQQELLTKARSIRALAPIPLTEALTLAQLDQSIETIIADWNERQYRLFSELYGAPYETARQLLNDCRFDTAKAASWYERSLYGEIDYIFLKQKSNEAIINMVLRHISDKYVFSDDADYLFPDAPWPDGITEPEKTLRILRTWMDFIDFEGLSFSETGMTTTIISLLDKQLQLPEFAGLLLKLAERERDFEGGPPFSIESAAAFNQWRDHKEAKHNDPLYKSLNEQIAACLPMLEDRMIQYVRDHQADFE